MTTPIFDFVKKYAENDGVRLHMPGHKGVGTLGCERYDITEISGADVLYSADGIINESENNLTAIYGTEHSFYSTQGSTLAIFAMLSLVSKRIAGEEKPLILAARNVHTAFVKAIALLDIDVEWIYPLQQEHLCSCNITEYDLREALSGLQRKTSAVYVTSPDYLGNLLDISALAAVCRDFDVPLLVDNAHGAYLKFLHPDIHPISLGAAMCADSAHKTLPVLTGGAYLHISKDFAHYTNNARAALSLFASTSPSYLTLSSLDICNKYLSENYPAKLVYTCELISRFKDALLKIGLFVEASEPLKIVINAKKSNVDTAEVTKMLRLADIEPEFVDDEYVVLMPSVNTSEEDFEKTLNVLKNVERFAEATSSDAIFVKKHERVMSVREAMLAESESINAEEATGRICAASTVSCPPAVPIVISGERITNEDIALFKKYGVNNVSVIKI